MHATLEKAPAVPGTIASRRGPRSLVWLLGFVVVATALLALAPGARAVHDENLFELGPGAGTDEGGLTNILGDGNSANGPDWANYTGLGGGDGIFNATGAVVFPGAVAGFIKDDLSQSSSVDRTTFSGAGGSNKNNDPISGPGDTWHWDTGNVPAKDDLANAYAYATISDNEHLIVYVGFERLDPSGDSHIDFEFFQDHVSLDEAVPCNDPGPDPTPCAWLGNRTPGDIIVSMDFLNGGGFGTLSIHEWDGTIYQDVITLTGQGCNPTVGSIPADAVCGFNNNGTISGGPWPNYDRHGKVITSLPANSFTEFGIDITALEQETPCLTTVLGKTRSSQSFTAELKDFAGPLSFPLCSATIAIGPDDTNEVGQSHTFTVWVNQTIAGTTTPAPDGTIVNVTLTDANGALANLISDDCASPGTSGGTCNVTFYSDSAGTVTGHASATVQLLGENVTVETDGIGGNSGDAVKTYVDATISIAADDTNRVGESHTFVVTVKEDAGDGAGFVPASGEDVDFSLTNGNGASYVLNAAASTCDNAGGNTNASGQCTIVFTSPTTGTVTGYANSSVQVGGLSLFRETDGVAPNSGNAVKTFVDARISITPDDVNEVGESHTFNVTVEKDDGSGSGFQPADGEHVDFALLNDNGALYILDAGASTCDDAGPNTDSSGNCSIVFTSNLAGLVNGSASADVHVGGLIIHVETDGAGENSGNATKRFVDAYILINPPEDTNSIEETHIFTVTVKVNYGDGAGFVDAPDGTIVTVILTPADGATIEDEVNDCLSPGTVSGNCTVSFTSSTAGNVTGHANVSLDAFGVFLQRETDGSGQNSGDALKIFIAGSLAWTKVDNVGRYQGGATFEVCRTHDWNSDTESFDAITPVCVDVTDNVAPDADPDNGQFLLEDLILGRYTVHETVPPPGYQADPKTEEAYLNLTDPDGVILEPFVNQRPSLKLTGFGYENTPTGLPGDGVVSGTMVYTFSVQNFGNASALLNLTFNVTVPGGAGGGTVVYDGSTGPTPSSEPGLGDDCIAFGCEVVWSDVPVAAAGNAGDSVTFTVTIVYNNVADGTQLQADLAATYTVDPSDGYTRNVSGAPLTLIITIQGD